MQMKFLLLSVLVTLSSTCVYKNEKFQDGDTWVVRSTFVMKCEIKNGGWTTRVIGCRTPQGLVVEPGKTIKEADTSYECIAMGNGKVEIKRTYDFKATKGCNGHEIGEEWVSERNFKTVCTEKGARIKECLTDVGIPVALNTNLALSGVVYSCMQHKNGTVSINREAAPSKSQNIGIDNLRPVEVLGPMFKRQKALGKLLDDDNSDSEDEIPLEKQRPVEKITCQSKGKTYQVEETWISENKFTKKCTPDGSVVILNCLINDKTTINVNSELKLGSQLYKCYRNKEEGRVYFEILNA